jgi:hypothetical protein
MANARAALAGLAETATITALRGKPFAPNVTTVGDVSQAVPQQLV